MATHQFPAIFSNVPNDKELLKIAEAIGCNWDLLAPFLLIKNSLATVDQIKEDKRTTMARIYELLIKWRQQAGQKASFGELFHQMLQVSSVTVGWSDIAEYLKVTEKEIRTCKKGYQPMVSNSGQPVQQQFAHGDNEEEMEVETLATSDNTEQTDGPSLRSRQEDKSYRPPKDTCLFDGRLLKLEKRDIEELKRTCTKRIGKGAFGEVFAGVTRIPEGFGIRIAVKKICFGKNDANRRSVRREMNSSRILHQFILPLLAVVDPNDGLQNSGNIEPLQEVWFVSPYCEKGNLHTAIQDDHKASSPNDEIQMNHITRLRILLQVALAIQYIHTAVPNVRKVILHKDISSKNVVLDAHFNARLIDFGLAREKDDNTTNAVGNKYYLHPDDGVKEASESWDYYAYGVVIREMLTGLQPEGDTVKYLKRMEPDAIFKQLQNNVWPNSPVVSERAGKLNGIAQECLKATDWTVTRFRDTVVVKIDEIWKKCNSWKFLEIPDDYNKCHICMINPMAKETSMKQEHAGNCTQKINVCIACEKNSFLNPITCYCGKELNPGIGHRWGALLVAGNDITKPSLAQALTKDLTELRNVITSKAPRIMGISEEKVRIVVPDKPGKLTLGEEPELQPKVRKEIQNFSKETEVDTLLIYFSCHGSKGNGTGDNDSKNRFELGSVKDCISLECFQKDLESLENIDELIIILDRCYPPMLRVKNRKKLTQINACKEDQKADFNDQGSAFTKYLIQGLKAESEKTCEESCKICHLYWENRCDFISVHNLVDYIKDHMKDKTPMPDYQQISNSSYVAYYTDEVVKIEFSTKDGKKVTLPLQYFGNIPQLKEKLLAVFKKDKNLTTVTIQKDTFRKKNQCEDCTSLEMVMSAWVLRQPLKVDFN